LAARWCLTNTRSTGDGRKANARSAAAPIRQSPRPTRCDRANRQRARWPGGRARGPRAVPWAAAQATHRPAANGRAACRYSCRCRMPAAGRVRSASGDPAPPRGPCPGHIRTRSHRCWRRRGRPRPSRVCWANSLRPDLRVDRPAPQVLVARGLHAATSSQPLLVVMQATGGDLLGRGRPQQLAVAIRKGMGLHRVGLNETQEWNLTGDRIRSDAGRCATDRRTQDLDPRPMQHRPHRHGTPDRPGAVPSRSSPPTDLRASP